MTKKKEQNSEVLGNVEDTRIKLRKTCQVKSFMVGKELFFNDKGYVSIEDAEMRANFKRAMAPYIEE